MELRLPKNWGVKLKEEVKKPYVEALKSFLNVEQQNFQIYPQPEDVFSALKLTPYEKVKVLILGQDPYHGPGQAHGLSFSVKPGVGVPPSLLNIYKELKEDVGCFIPNNGYLAPWAEQGVLMLNAVLTVRAHQANSHQGKGWENFTDAIIKKVNEKDSRVVFILWGAYAKKKEVLIDTKKHAVIKSAHPSPLSAYNGFFGSKPFSKTNQLLMSSGQEPVDWQIPNI